MRADGSFDLPAEPGDYVGPVRGYSGDRPAVLYLLPNARDPDVHGPGRAIRYVVSPPHRFFEEADGSLTIRDSIGAQPHWHGWLTGGVWHTEPPQAGSLPQR